MVNVKKDIELAVCDVSQAFSQWSICTALGWNDVKSRYNRSKLGAFWASLSILIFVSAVGPIYASLSGVELREYMLHLLLGFIVWNYMSGIVMESGREFVNSANYLISFQLGYFTLLFRVVWRNFIVLAYQMVVFLLFAIVLQQPFDVIWLLTPVALFLISLNALWMGLLMSVFATRFRDLSELMNNLLRLAFFVTPIMWMPTHNQELGLIADLNPFFHLIELFREPLLGGQTNWVSWIVAFLLGILGWLIAFPIFAKYRTRIAFWL
ncbi:MAG: ABC transporter permease [Arenicella sp.]